MDRDQNHTHTITFSQQITYTHHVRPLWSVILPMFLFVIFYTSVFANTYSYSLIQHAHLLWNSLPLSTLFLSLAPLFFTITKHLLCFGTLLRNFFIELRFVFICLLFHLFWIGNIHMITLSLTFGKTCYVSLSYYVSLALKTKITTRLNVLYYYLYS